ncbi:MAG TPA: hypothetical protein VL866_01480 [Pyrinomonadaceae bacterium]|nr:hypothetical protein [Pyrinomonadaceae bacterium]
MITAVKVLRSGLVLICCAAMAMAQNQNSSNAATLSGSPLGLVAGGVVLLALGLVFGVAVASKRKKTK